MQPSEAKNTYFNNFDTYIDTEEATIQNIQGEIVHTGQGNINQNSPNINITGDNKGIISQSSYSTDSNDNDKLERFLKICHQLQKCISDDPEISSQQVEDIKREISTLKIALENPSRQSISTQGSRGKVVIKGNFEGNYGESQTNHRGN